MDIIGKVIQKLDIQSGTSATTGKTWQSLTFIIETIENYPRKVAIELFGEQRIKDNPVEIDQVYTISFDLESREFNGRWYTSARAWKIVAGMPQVAPAAAAPQQVMPQQMPTIPQAAPQAAQQTYAAPQAAPQPAPQSFDAAANNMLDDNSGLPF